MAVTDAYLTLDDLISAMVHRCRCLYRRIRACWEFLIRIMSLEYSIYLSNAGLVAKDNVTVMLDATSRTNFLIKHSITELEELDYLMHAFELPSQRFTMVFNLGTFAA